MYLSAGKGSPPPPSPHVAQSELMDQLGRLLDGKLTNHGQEQGSHSYRPASQMREDINGPGSSRHDDKGFNSSPMSTLTGKPPLYSSDAVSVYYIFK